MEASPRNSQEIGAAAAPDDETKAIGEVNLLSQLGQIARLDGQVARHAAIAPSIGAVAGRAAHLELLAPD